MKIEQDDLPDGIAQYQDAIVGRNMALLKAMRRTGEPNELLPYFQTPTPSLSVLATTDGRPPIGTDRQRSRYTIGMDADLLWIRIQLPIPNT